MKIGREATSMCWKIKKNISVQKNFQRPRIKKNQDIDITELFNISYSEGIHLINVIYL